MQPRDVARVLAEIATLLELGGADAFRTRAFSNAARALEATEVDLQALAREDRLTELRGVGEGLAGVIREIVLSGKSRVHEELVAATPVGLFDLMRLPGLGTKRIRQLHQQLGVESLDSLEAAARAGRVAALSGFGAKTEAKILDGIGFVRRNLGLRRYPDALEVAVRLLEWARQRPEVAAADIVGGLRRRMEVVDSVDLVIASSDARLTLGAFAELNGVTGVAERSDGRVSARLSDGLAVGLRCVQESTFVGAVVWETGSAEHVAALAERAAQQGMELGPDGLRRDGELLELPDEAALYNALRVSYLPPELREGLGEVEAAVAGRVPRLVEVGDLRGAFHCHSTYSDGKATLEEMAQGARALNWAYLGTGDHSRSAAYAGGLPAARVRQQHREIDRLNRDFARGGGEHGFRIFKGIESDILPDGSLDYPDAVLRSFDYVVGSVHSSFQLPREEMTQRVIRAVRNPHLTILGHPTGRLLLTRAAYDIDVRAVIDAAVEAGVVLEINANAHRLDLDWREARYAAGRGALIAINPDAHSVAGLAHVTYGVNMARKAGLEPRQVLNCWTLDEVEDFFAARKQAGQG